MNRNVGIITEDLWRIYATEQGNSTKSCFENAGIPATAIAELPAISCYERSAEETAKFFMARYRVPDLMLRAIYDAVLSILSFGSSPENPRARAFLTRCAEVYLLKWSDMYGGQYVRPSLPCCLGRNSTLVDLASGPEFVNFFCDLAPTTIYYAIDKSFFVTECVRLKAKADGIDNVIALEKDVMDLRKSDIAADVVEIIRAKNVFTYVPKYLSAFQQYLSWIDSGGSFVFEEQASEKTANAVFFNSLISQNFQNLIKRGWNFSYFFGDSANPLDLNTVMLSKSSDNSISDNLSKLEQFYIELSTKYGGT